MEATHHRRLHPALAVAARGAAGLSVGVFVTGILTFGMHAWWYRTQGGPLLLGYDPPAAAPYYEWLVAWVKPWIWWLPAFTGGLVAGLVGRRPAWLWGGLCGLLALYAFRLRDSVNGTGPAWQDTLETAYPCAALAGGIVVALFQRFYRRAEALRTPAPAAADSATQWDDSKGGAGFSSSRGSP